jgi:hypothetical protein
MSPSPKTDSDQAKPEGTLLKPLTRHAVARLRGIFKRRPGEKPFAKEWAERKAEEKALEEAKYEHSTRRSR